MKTKSIIKIILLIFMFLTVLQQNYLAQSINWQWARSAGSGGSEIAEASVLDASGNLYVLGWYTSASITFGATTLINPGVGTSDFFLTKYDASGNVLWAKTFGGTDGEVGNCITADAAGNVYISGWFSSTNLVMGTYTLANTTAGKTDMFVAKLNSSGNTVWAKSAGGTDYDRGYGIAIEGNGNVFVTGCFASTTINFGTGVHNTAGTDDFFIVKYDASGTTQWSKSAGGTAVDAGLSVATDSTGSAYVTGRYLSSSINFGSGTHTNAGTLQDLFVVKYNSAGIAQWSFGTGGTGDDYGDDIMVNKQGVYITGGFSSASISVGTTTLNNAATGLGDVLLAKFDYNGNPSWAKKAGGTDLEWGYDLVSDSVGNIFVSGTFISNTLAFGSTTLTNVSPGFRDMFVAGYDGNGNALWAAGAGGSYEEAAYSVAVNSTASDIYIAGFFNSPTVSFGTNVVSKGCGEDVVVAKMTSPAVGIKEEFLANQLTVYPNPTSGKFTVEAQGQIMFYSVLGENILNAKLKNQNKFDFSSLPKGIYFYKILTEKKGTYTGSVIVE